MLAQGSEAGGAASARGHLTVPLTAARGVLAELAGGGVALLRHAGGAGSKAATALAGAAAPPHLVVAQTLTAHGRLRVLRG